MNASDTYSEAFTAARLVVLALARRFLGAFTIQQDDRDVVVLRESIVDEELVLIKRSVLVELVDGVRAARSSVPMSGECTAENPHGQLTGRMPDGRKVHRHDFVTRVLLDVDVVLDAFPLQYAVNDMVIHVNMRMPMMITEVRRRFHQMNVTGPQYIAQSYGTDDAIGVDGHELRPDPFAADRCSTCGEVGTMKGGDESDCRSARCSEKRLSGGE